MKELTPRSFLALVLCLTVGQAYAAAPTVGLVVAKSTIRIDASPVVGNATVLSGNVLESAGGTSELRMRGGSVVMATAARIRVFQNHAELQSGKIQMTGDQLYAKANGLSVQASTGGTAVMDRQGNKLLVGSLRGSVQVTNSSGVLLARLEPGHAMAFGGEQAPLNPTGQAAGQTTGTSGTGAGASGTAGAGAPASGAGAASGTGAAAGAAGAGAAGAGSAAAIGGLSTAVVATLGVGVAAAVGVGAVAATRSSESPRVSR